jgi:hypothetical protein
MDISDPTISSLNTIALAASGAALSPGSSTSPACSPVPLNVRKFRKSGTCNATSACSEQNIHNQGNQASLFERPVNISVELVDLQRQILRVVG